MGNAYDLYVHRVRDHYGRLTPFRLGVMVGRAGDTLASPYEPGSRGERNFQAGVVFGRVCALKDLQAQARRS